MIILQGVNSNDLFNDKSFCLLDCESPEGSNLSCASIYPQAWHKRDALEFPTETINDPLSYETTEMGAPL